MAGSFSGSDFSGAAVADSPSTESSSSVETTSTDSTPASTESSTPAVESTPPAQATSADAPPERKRRGPISTDDHEKVVKNTREKTRAEVEKEWEPYAWAKTANQAEVEQATQWRSFAKRDPVGFLETAIAEAEANPQLAPQIKSLAARLLGRRGQQQVEAAFDEEPGPDIPTDASNGVPVVYSAAQLRKRDAWFKKQLLSEVGQVIAPIAQETKATSDERAYYHAVNQANDFAQREFAAAQKWPGFKENIKEIADRVAKLQLQSDDPREVSLAFRDAYHEVVFPKLATSAHSAAIADVNRKVSASSVNPGATTQSPPQDPTRMSWTDSVRAEMKRAGMI